MFVCSENEEEKEEIGAEREREVREGKRAAPA